MMKNAYVQAWKTWRWDILSCGRQIPEPVKLLSHRIFIFCGHDARGDRGGTWQMKDTRLDRNENSLTYGRLAKTSNLIRSLRDDEQLKSQEPRSASGCAIMTRASGRSKLR